MNPIQSGRTIAGKYRLEECRAHGGMGSVWQARHLLLDTPLAIKFIDPQFAFCREARCRFEREAKTVALLRSNHVAHIHDYGVEEEIPYIVMELLHGEDLSARLNRDRRLPLEVAVNIVTQVCKVLKSAHAAGVIHRDLKPGNIFLVPGDEDEEIVKVLDFGVAKMMTTRLDAHTDLTKSGILMGSPRYMSPEQARGMKGVDHRTDLWSLGVIAYRMITGEVPFPGTEIGDVILKICTYTVPAPSLFVPDLPEEIDRFFKRALSRDPSARFQSAEQMARAFACAAGQAPPSSLRAPPPIERLLAGFAFSEGDRGDPPSRPRVEEPITAREGRGPVKTTRTSSVACDLDATLPSPSLRHGEHIVGLGDRLRWSAVGAGGVSVLLGALLLLSQGAPTAASPAAPAGVPLVEVLAPPPVELAPVPATLHSAPIPVPSVSARRSPPLPWKPRPQRDRSAKNILGI